MKNANENINNENVQVAFKSEEGKNAVFKYYESLLNEAEDHYEEIVVSTSFGDTYIIAMGEKSLPPIVLLHGSGMNSAMWIKEMKEYSLKHRVYAIDMPGEPGKSDERQLPFEGDYFPCWLNEVCDELLIKKTSIVGISLGAWAGTKFAVKYPNKVDKLVLLCPAGIGPQKKSFALKALFYSILGDKGIDKLYCKVNGDKPMPEIILNYQKLIGRHFNFRKEIIPLFSDEELIKLKMPITLFVGAKDIMFYSEKTANRLKSIVNHAKINLMENEGHSIVNQGECIREFLK